MGIFLFVIVSLIAYVIYYISKAEKIRRANIYALQKQVGDLSKTISDQNKTIKLLDISHLKFLNAVIALKVNLIHARNPNFIAPEQLYLELQELREKFLQQLITENEYFFQINTFLDSITN